MKRQRTILPAGSADCGRARKYETIQPKVPTPIQSLVLAFAEQHQRDNCAATMGDIHVANAIDNLIMERIKEFAGMGRLEIDGDDMAVQLRDIREGIAKLE